MLLQRAAEFYSQNFANSDKARALVAQFGLSDNALLERAEIGYSDGRLSECVPSDRESRDKLVQVGLLGADGSEYLEGHLVFTMRDVDGRIVNLWGLAKSGIPKFLPNLPVTTWNVVAVKQSVRLYVTLSPIEALSLHAAGYSNVVAIDPNHGVPDMKAFSAYGIQTFTVVVGEGAEAEKTAATLVGKFLPLAIGSLVVPAKSVNEVLTKRGAKVLAEFLTANAHGVTAVHVPGMQPVPGGFTLPIGKRRYEVRGLEQSARHLKATVRAECGGRIFVDTLDFYSASARKRFVLDLVRHCEESADLITADVAKLLSACEIRAKQPDMVIPIESANQMPEADRKEGEAMGRAPDLIEIIMDDIARLGIVGEEINKLLFYLAMTARKLPEALAILLLASSGAGKSILQRTVCDLCPPEDILKVTHLSGKALFHLTRTAIKYKVILIEEFEGARLAVYPLRALISEGVLTTQVAGKDPATGRLTTMQNTVEGPATVFMTTTDSTGLDSETRSRFIVTSINESREQTRAILNAQRRRCTLDGLKGNRHRNSIYRRHHAFQRVLQPLAVVNPYVDRLCCEDRSLTGRRDQPKILRLIDAVAFLRQLQKPVKIQDGRNYIEVDETDLKIASRLIQELFVHNLSELSRPAYRLLMILDEMRHKATAAAGDAPAYSFTRKKIREHSGWEHTRVHRYLTELVLLEYARPVSTPRGEPHAYKLLWEQSSRDQPPLFGLPFTDPTPSENSAAVAKA